MSSFEQSEVIRKINEVGEVSLSYEKSVDAYGPTGTIDSNILEYLGFRDRLFKVYELDSLLIFLGSRSLTLCTIGGPDE